MMLNLRVCPERKLVSELGEKKLVCFGAGKGLKKFLDRNSLLHEKIICILDNAGDMDGSSRHGYPVKSVDSFTKTAWPDFAVIIVSSFYGSEMIKQLEGNPFFDGKDCYVSMWNMSMYEEVEINFSKDPQKIPKVIHYCWFGKGPVPSHLQKYIDTWKRFCPDYEIKRWDESNYDISKNKYMKQAYEAKKYGFVPDYARLDIVRHHGGIYLDTDVELLRSIDGLLCYDFFCGFEADQRIAFGLGFGAVKGHPLLDRLLSSYNNLEFIQDGVMNLTASPDYQSAIMKEEGFVLNGEYQERGGVVLFPAAVLDAGGPLASPVRVSKNSVSVHHYEASWVEETAAKKTGPLALRELFAKTFTGFKRIR